MIQDVDSDEYRIHYMQKTASKSDTAVAFRWPSKKDELWVAARSYLGKIDPPQPTGRSKRLYTISTKDISTIVGQFEASMESSD